MSETRMSYIVICLLSAPEAYREGGHMGGYTLATRRVFSDFDHACKYAATVTPSRKAIVVSGDWSHLRFE